jgi:hypothetical protein
MGMQRARGVLKIKPKSTVSAVGRANAMCVGIDDNASLFSTPAVATSAIQAQVVVVNKCEVVVATRARGSASARDVQRKLLVGMLETELTYLQGIADKAPTYDQAVSILEAGGVLVAIVPPHIKAILEIKQGPAGSVSLDANVAALTAGLRGKFSFNWESTLDGKSFATLPSTPNHLTTVANLTPMTSYGFRVSVTNAAGVSQPWSQVVYFVVR